MTTLFHLKWHVIKPVIQSIIYREVIDINSQHDVSNIILYEKVNEITL